MRGLPAMRGALGRLRLDERGAAAIEFVLIAPLLLLLFLGGTELGVALTVDRKVKSAAFQAVDLVSRSLQVSEADLRGMYGAARLAVAPYSPAPLRLRVTQIRIDARGDATVDWDCPTSGLEKLAQGTPVVLSREYAGWRNRYILRGETTYAFEPITGQVFGRDVVLRGTSYVTPRYGVPAPGYETPRVLAIDGGCDAFAL